MTKALYTAQAHVDGGRIDGHGHSSDGELEVELRPWPSMRPPSTCAFAV